MSALDEPLERLDREKEESGYFKTCAMSKDDELALRIANAITYDMPQLSRDERVIEYARRLRAAWIKQQKEQP